jgi:prephenate dehydrogenase
MKISIIGTGLMGGSLGLALKKEGHFITGVDHNTVHLEQALSIGAIDTVLPLHMALTDCELVVICVPVDATLHVLPEIMDHISDKTTVMDLGSTKVDICNSISNHKNRKNFVAVHPMAGVEHSGPLAAHVDLYLNAKAIVCDPQKSSSISLNTVLSILQELKMKVIFMDAMEHDRQLALVSHLPQVVAYALASMGDFDLEDNKEWVELGGGGLQSSIRLGKSNAEMWMPIFQQNKENLLKYIDNYMNQLDALRQMIVDDNRETLKPTITSANTNYEKLNYRRNKAKSNVEIQGAPKVYYS